MSAEEDRVGRVLAALERLRRADPTPWSQGLSPEGARLALEAAAGAITAEGLRAELRTPGRRPRAAAVIVAWGVFTSPLEWVALLAAAGVEPLLKPPSADPAFSAALVEALLAEGLPARLLAGRELPPEAELILAFGSDPTMEALAEQHPDRRLVLHGHRFSLALVHEGADLHAAARALALDHALYDTRGCMAPVAVLTDADPQALGEALYDALAEAQARWPRGPARLPALAARLRERAGLARVRGRARLGEGFAVLELPPRHFVPEALPRVAVIHPLGALDEAAALLEPWRPHLSTLGASLVTREGEDPRAPAFAGWFSRVCPLGTMQVPPFPRRHDGRPMLGSLVGEDQASGMGGGAAAPRIPE